MSVGQPYERKAWAFDLQQADCVTFTERCIALGCTDTWEQAYRLQNRLRYRNGTGDKADLNQEPILDWLPANGWLIAEMTAGLGVPLSEFDAHFEQRDQRTAYIPKEDLPTAYPKLETGDIVLIIADSLNPPSDPVMRTRCVHMAILIKEHGRIDMLHSYPPAASRWPLDRMLRNRYVRGAKILRLRPEARQLAAAESGRLQTRFNATVNQLDNRMAASKGRMGFISASRAPDSIAVINGIEYGVIQLAPGETLWSLFRGAYKGVCALPVNQEFMSKHPDLNAEKYAGERVYFPIRPSGDASGDPEPPAGH